MQQHFYTLPAPRTALRPSPIATRTREVGVIATSCDQDLRKRQRTNTSTRHHDGRLRLLMSTVRLAPRQLKLRLAAHRTPFARKDRNDLPYNDRPSRYTPLPSTWPLGEPVCDGNHNLSLSRAWCSLTPDGHRSAAMLRSLLRHPNTVARTNLITTDSEWEAIMVDDHSSDW